MVNLNTRVSPAIRKYMPIEKRFQSRRNMINAIVNKKKELTKAHAPGMNLLGVKTTKRMALAESMGAKIPGIEQQERVFVKTEQAANEISKRFRPSTFLHRYQRDALAAEKAKEKKLSSQLMKKREGSDEKNSAEARKKARVERALPGHGVQRDHAKSNETDSADDIKKRQEARKERYQAARDKKKERRRKEFQIKSLQRERRQEEESGWEKASVGADDTKDTATSVSHTINQSAPKTHIGLENFSTNAIIAPDA